MGIVVTIETPFLSIVAINESITTLVKSIPNVLAKAGYNDVNIVPEQAEPDGDFPTVSS